MPSFLHSRNTSIIHPNRIIFVLQELNKFVQTTIAVVCAPLPLSLALVFIREARRFLISGDGNGTGFLPEKG
jgi:hypothetical protein